MPNAVSLCKWWIFLLFAPLTLWAEESVPPLRLQLVSEVTTMVPGEPFMVGIYLQHAPHHHSYYKFPGIVGVGTNVTWDLPEGFQAGPIQWPTPEQVDMRGHGAYGYHQDTLLMATITPPESLAKPSSVRLAGKVGYMCCSQERCTPGFEDLEMTLLVGAETVADDTWRERFAKTRAALPKAIAGWKAEVVATEKRFILTLKYPEGLGQKVLPKPEALYFYSWNGWTASNEPHQCQYEVGGYTFTMPKHPFPDEEATRFQGVVRSETGWPGEPAGHLGLWVDCDLPNGGGTTEGTEDTERQK